MAEKKVFYSEEPDTELAPFVGGKVRHIRFNGGKYEASDDEEVALLERLASSNAHPISEKGPAKVERGRGNV